jgi:hypothetical protein
MFVQIPAAPDPPVPEAIVGARCLNCHAYDLILEQRLSRAGWEHEVDKMIRWGAKVVEADRPGLIDALIALARLPAESTGAERGAEVLGQSCLGCHGLDIIEQQRLGGTGWRREVDKMTSWGARIAAEDKDLLIAYLSERFGPP